MEIKAIGFDWGGVLVSYPGGDLHRTIAMFLGVCVEDVRREYFKHNDVFNKGKSAERLEEARDVWGSVLKELGFENRLDALMNVLREVPDVIPNTRVLELVKTLVEKGWKLGLLSNNSSAAGERVREMGHDQHFNVSLFSGDIGYMKPEPEAFKMLADGLGVMMEEMIFIDDSQRSLSSAPELGYEPILFQGYEQLVEALKERNIL
ncbi:MAG: HAD-IA family hydrolase [bacterium]|nr:HAD-IA family hydrolase [bacterium]